MAEQPDVVDHHGGADDQYERQAARFANGGWVGGESTKGGPPVDGE